MIRASVIAAMLLATLAARGAAQERVPLPRERTPLPVGQPTWIKKTVRTAPMTVLGTGAIAGFQKKVRTTPLQLTGTGAVAGQQSKSNRTAPM